MPRSQSQDQRSAHRRSVTENLERNGRRRGDSRPMPASALAWPLLSWIGETVTVSVHQDAMREFALGLGRESCVAIWSGSTVFEFCTSVVLFLHNRSINSGAIEYRLYGRISDFSRRYLLRFFDVEVRSHCCSHHSVFALGCWPAVRFLKSRSLAARRALTNAGVRITWDR